MMVGTGGKLLGWQKDVLGYIKLHPQISAVLLFSAPRMGIPENLTTLQDTCECPLRGPGTKSLWSV